MSSQVAEVSAKYLADAAQNAVPVGYKQTEVGVIPEDWFLEPLEEFTSFISYGFTNPMPTTHVGPYMITARDISDGKVQYKNARTTDIDAFNQLLTSKSRPKKNDLLLTKDGTLGRLALVEDEQICINQSVAILRPNQRIIPLFFKLLLESPYYQERMIEEAGGSTIKHIYITIVNRMPLSVPSDTKEQTAIANALSDVDALISELEKLITKKQAIKTATMQQLLTGRTRLPQFALREDGTPKGTKPSELGEIPEDWEVLGFGALFQSSVSKKRIKPMSLVSFVGMQDVTEQAQLSTQYVLAIENVKSGFTYFERGDVLVAKITPCFENGKGCHTETLSTDIGFGSTEFHVLRATDNSDSRFIYYWSNRNVFRKSLESEMVGSAGHRRVPLSAIAKYTIPVPSKEEQTTIATILSDMDAEIQALEQRLGKTRQIKQGMIQELLTGKTRLIQGSEAR